MALLPCSPSVNVASTLGVCPNLLVEPTVAPKENGPKEGRWLERLAIESAPSSKTGRLGAGWDTPNTGRNLGAFMECQQMLGAGMSVIFSL